MTTYQSQSTRVRQLFSTLAAVTASNPVLLEGEKWNEKDATTGRATGRSKTGDGVVSGTAPNQTITGTAFNDLPFDPGGSGDGASLSDATPQALGTAAAGTAATASRSDHRHAMPSAAQVGADATGTAAAAVAAHVAGADPHPTYTTAAEAAAAAPVQSVAGRTGAVTIAASDVSGLGTAATTNATAYATAAQGTKADTAVQPAGLAGYVQTSDSRLSDAREWSAATATQAEAEAGSSTTRLAFTPHRVFQAIAAWWAASAFKTKLDGIASGATANATDAQLRDRATHTGTQTAGTITGLATVATSGAYGDLSGRFDPASPGAIGGTAAAAGTFAQLLLPSQGSAPATPVSGFTLFANASNALSWVGANGYLRTFDGTGNTANRTYSLPDASGTIALTTGSTITQHYAARASITASSGTYTLDVTNSNEFVTAAALAGATTINLSNLSSIPSSGLWRGVLRFAYTSGTISWFTGNSGYTVKWDGGSAITPTAGETECVVIEVYGTTVEVAALRGRA